MFELILLFIALAALSLSSGAAVFFCGVAVAVMVARNRMMKENLARLQHDLADQTDALRREIRSTRDVADKLASRLTEANLSSPEIDELRREIRAVRDLVETSPSRPSDERPSAPEVRHTPPTVELPRAAAPVPPPAPGSVEVPKEVPTPSPVVPEPKPVVPAPIAPPPPPPVSHPTPAPYVAKVDKPTTPPPPPKVAATPARPSVSASVQAPPAPQFRTRPPAPSLSERLRKALDLEETLGTNWLTKIGIVLVVLGVALFGMYELKELGAAGKVLLLATIGASMLGFGVYLDRGERYRILGRTAIGGGWALLFFTSYAAHHVDAMRVLFSETPDLILMLTVAVAMALHTLRYRSQTVTGLAFLLAYSTIALTQDTVYALTAGATLSIGLVVIALRMQWFELEIFGILSSYLNHLYWLYKLLGVEGANHHPFPQFAASTSILALYWFVYRFSYVARKIQTPLQERISAVAALLNTLLLLAVMKFQSVHPEYAFYALLVLGALELSFGQAVRLRGRRRAFILLSVLGATLMIMAVPFRYTGENRAILWMIGAEAFLAAGILLRENVFRRIGNATALLVALHIAALEIVPLFQARAASAAPLIHAGTLLLTAGALFYINAHPLRARWPELFAPELDLQLLMTQSYCGAFTLALGLWAIVPYQWTALSWAVLMIAIAFAAWRYKNIELYHQAILIAVITTFRAFWVNFPAFSPGDSPHMPRVVIVSLIAAALYLAAWPLQKVRGENWPRNLLTWLGTALLTYLIFTDVQQRWMCVAWLALGIGLIFPARRWKLDHLCYQENLLAIFAASFAWDNLFSGAPPSFIQRIAPTLLVSAGLYAISRKASSWTDQRGRWIAYLHTWAASALVAGICFVEFRAEVLPVVWMAFALVLAWVSRRFNVKEFSAQSHVMSALAVIQTIVAVLPSETKFHLISERLLVTSAVAAGLYLMARLVPMSDEQRRLEFHHVYTWVASTLVGTLLWYELQPLSVAVAWALLGLLLFEIGTLRRIRQLRYQGYVALFSSFGRIFVVNLAASGPPGDWLSPRMLTVVPVAAILFFVYSQIAFSEDADSKIGRLDVTALLAYAGTISVVSVLYFQVSPPWIAAAWSVLVPILLSAALFLEQEVFLQQAILLSAAILSRGMIHNLFGGSYFTELGWKGRFAELGAAILVMLLSLPLAFRLKLHFVESAKHGRFRNALTKLVRRPEQVIFFVPITLLTFMLALKMRAGMVTVAWGVEAVAVVLLALIVNERSFRIAGMGLLLLSVGKIAVIDAWRLAPRDRYLTFIFLGLAAIGVSYLYTRYRESIRQYL
jgi:hypothetical protein